MTQRNSAVSRYNGPDNLTDWATSATVSPGGSIVYVTGFSEGRISDLDYATVAYNPSWLI